MKLSPRAAHAVASFIARCITFVMLLAMLVAAILAFRFFIAPVFDWALNVKAPWQ